MFGRTAGPCIADIVFFQSLVLIGKGAVGSWLALAIIVLF
jgi:hypothetical protein